MFRSTSFLVELRPKGPILVVSNEDRPGVIGAVGSLLGGAGINVNGLHVAHDQGSKNALALWSLDEGPGDALLAKLRELPLVGSALLVEL